MVFQRRHSVVLPRPSPAGDRLVMVHVEQLERRALLSAAVADVSLDEGTLQIIGTNKADVISVSLKDEANIQVTLNGDVQEFALVDVQLINIKSLQGADNVAISEDITISTHIVTGQGRDSVLGGGGSDDVDGEMGKDWINGRAGNDTLRGRQGPDTIIGGEGDDFIVGGQGKDSLGGAMGNDTVIGGIEEDTLKGGLGDDTLDGGDGEDSLSGGAGADHYKDTDNDPDSIGRDGEDALTGDKGDDGVLDETPSDLLA